MFAACTELLKTTFDGTLTEPIAALFVVSMAADWDFYYWPLAEHGKKRIIVFSHGSQCYDCPITPYYGSCPFVRLSVIHRLL